MIKANEDLEIATVLIDQKSPIVAGAAFHTQQAAEKVLKAFLIWHDQPFKKSHDLEEIGRACENLDAGLATAISRVASISPWAIESRYPGDWNLPSRFGVADSIEDVRELFRQIFARLPEETHP